ncbi:MAG TPA: hypothetical protein VLU43_13370 [Anaeromyxobacteraceae bacterium]|nr:hypothetical protein [Anaeromyxobacteraceae bacterium]
MKRLSSMLVAVAAALGGCYATVGADGQGGGGAAFTLSLPEVPPLVVVQPGVSVVRDMNQEVFYTDGYYWARQDQGWYRTRDHHSGWARVDDHHVPTAIAQSPPGRYRNYHGDGHQANDGHQSNQEHQKHD